MSGRAGMAGDPTLDGLTLPDILRRPSAELRALQDRLLARMVEVAYDNHPFYGVLMRREGLEPRHIRTCDELVRLPPTSKTDFLADPDSFRLREDGLPPQETALQKVIYTTGTTSGRPAPVYVTTFDTLVYMFDAGRRAEFYDLGPGDLIANLFPLAPYPLGAYSRAVDEAASCGAAILYCHTGRFETPFPAHNSLDRAVELVARHRATILWGVASFVRRVLVRAEETGADLSSVRMAMITGEASSGGLRDDIRRRLVAFGCREPKVVNRYGSTEQGSSMVECQEGSGFHSLAPDHLFHEVVDPATGARLNDGEPGQLAFTHLLRRGTLFLRYLVGDHVTMSNAPCPFCSRTSPRITSQPVRTGDIVKVKGTLVNFQLVKDKLEGMAAVEEYQIVVRPADVADEFSLDELVIRVAARPEHRADLERQIRTEIGQNIQVTPVIEFVAKDVIYDPASMAKPRRVVDLR